MSDIPGLSSDQWFWVLMGLSFVVPFAFSFLRGKSAIKKRIEKGDITVDDLDRVAKMAQGKKNGKSIIVKMSLSGPILVDTPAGFLGAAPSMKVISARKVCKTLKEFGERPEIKAVFLTLTTPGGSPVGSQMIGEAILELRRLGKKVFVYVEEMSASGGVWVMVHADTVVIEELSYTGSIGVVGPTIFEYIDVRAQGSLFGSQVEAGKILAHPISTGKGKQFGNPYVPYDADVGDHYNLLFEQRYGDFLNTISRHRPNVDIDEIKKLGALLISAGRSFRLGLTDMVGNEASALELLRKLLGNPDESAYSVYTLTIPQKSLAKKIFGGASTEEPRLSHAETIAMIRAELGGCFIQALSSFALRD